MTQGLPPHRQHIFSISEAARFLGISIDTLRNWEKSGKLTPQRTQSGNRRYRLEQLKRVLEEKFPHLKLEASEPSLTLPAEVFIPRPKIFSDNHILVVKNAKKNINIDLEKIKNLPALVPSQALAATKVFVAGTCLAITLTGTIVGGYLFAPEKTLDLLYPSPESQVSSLEFRVPSPQSPVLGTSAESPNLLAQIKEWFTVILSPLRGAAERIMLTFFPDKAEQIGLEDIKREQEIVKKIEEKKNLQQEVEKTRLMLATKKESILNNERAVEQLKIQITTLQSLNFNESFIEEFERKSSILKNEMSFLNEQNISFATEISSLNLMINEKEFLKKNLSRLETCPTCLQSVDPNYKANVQNKLENEIANSTNKIKEISLKKQELSSRIRKLESEIFELEKRIQELRILKIKIEGMKEKQKTLSEIETIQSSLQKDLILLNSHIQSLQDFVFELNKYNNLLQEKKSQLEKAIFEERKTEVKLAELKKEMHMIEIQIGEISERIYKTEKIKSELYYLTDLENWLSKKFLPIVSFIEKNVMVKLKIEFSKLFSEWFSMLVSEQFNINLREDFSPVIEQQDYELEYEYLSGGERTAIALAYRLALNQIINSFLGKIKTRDFVILDEPTDGFSEQQLDKMRDVLQELNVAQLIIVSHEQKIEGFVENVIRFAKKDNASFIEKTR